MEFPHHGHYIKAFGGLLAVADRNRLRESAEGDVASKACDRIIYGAIPKSWGGQHILIVERDRYFESTMTFGNNLIKVVALYPSPASHASLAAVLPEKE